MMKQENSLSLSTVEMIPFKFTRFAIKILEGSEVDSWRERSKLTLLQEDIILKKISFWEILFS